MTNVFLNNQKHNIKIKRFLYVKQITFSFFSNSWNKLFIVYGICKTRKAAFTENYISSQIK